MKTAFQFVASIGAVLAIASGAEGSPGEPTGRWIGQDGHDLVGCFANPGKSDIQDLHFVLQGLPARARIVSAVVHGGGGGEWKFNGPPNSWLALIEKAPGATTADVYVEPYIVEKGRLFEFQLTYDDGSKGVCFVQGGKADPNLRTAAARMEVRWIGQDGSDRATTSPNVGPDGLQDVHLAL
jgi:hypothetical protein